MGVHNVEQAGLLAAQKNLGHRAARLLTWMANKALDEKGRDGAEPRLYFAGRAHLAIGIGRLATEADLPVVQRAVRETLQDLVDAEAIQRVGKAYTGHQATYRLLLPAKIPDSRPALAAVQRLLMDGNEPRRRTGTGGA